MLQLLVRVTRFVVSIQLPHYLFSVSHNPYKLGSVLAQLPPLACNHIRTNIIYIHKHRQTENWHLLTVCVHQIFKMSQTFEL